jgi:catechol 2,3-dioxygenase-like lactoylglutathione lyase family enzyme
VNLGAPTEMFIVSDPDGTQIELLEGPSVHLSHVAINCTDIERSQRFYEDVMGLRTVLDIESPPIPGEVFRLDGEVQLARAPHARHDDGIHGRVDFMAETLGHELGLP